MEEVDIKISAVFSLAPDLSSPDYLSQSKDSPSGLPKITDDVLNSSTDSAPSEDEAPPTLSAAAKTRKRRRKVNSKPPILHPEEQEQMSAFQHIRQPDEMPCYFKDKMSSATTASRKIAPSYIVLKSIEQYLGGKSSISYRKFKRTFSDCTNMCKKIYFIRRLRSGRDVFNVKTPSKQKEYYLYLEQKKNETSKKNKLTGMRFRSLKSIFNTKPFDISARNKTDANHMKRVRRTVTKIPKDFRSLSSVMNKLSKEDEANLEEEERMKRQAELRHWKQHVFDALVLRKQISIKRSHNRKLKKLKSKSKSNLETKSILKSEVTSSVSGRVCKRNMKYLTGFAVDQTEINEQLCVEKTNDQLKKLYNDTNLMKQKRQTEDYTIFPAHKKSKSNSDIFIENPEKEIVTHFKSKSREQTKSKKHIRRRRAFSKEENPYSGKYGVMSSNNVEKDGVLIQEMPNEGSVIADILQSKPKPSLACNVGEALSTKLCKPAVLPKLIEKSVVPVRVPVQSLPQSMNLKALEHTNISNDGVPVSTVAFSKVSGHTALAASYAPLTSHSSKINSPVLVRTPDGLRYIIPQAETIQVTTKPAVSVIDVSTCRSQANSGTPTVVTVKNVGRLPSNVPTLTPRQSSMTTSQPHQSMHQNVNMSLLASGNSLIPFISVVDKDGQNTCKPIVVAKTGPIPTAITQTIQRLPSGSGNTLAQKWSPAPNIVKLQTTTAQSSPISITSPVLVRCPSQSISPSVVGVSQGLCKIGTPAVSVTSLLASTPTALNTNATSQYSLIKAQSTANTTKTGLLDLKPVVNDGAVNTPEKTKFYLLKIDGKNVLIPVEGCQFQPKAYVVNGDIPTTLPSATTSAVRHSAVNGVPVIHKPTLAVEPSVKIPNAQLNPPITIKQEPMDDWSEHLMKTTIQASNPIPRVQVNTIGLKHGSEPKAGVIMVKQQSIHGRLSAKLVPNQLSKTVIANRAMTNTIARPTTVGTNVTVTNRSIVNNSSLKSSASCGVDTITTVTPGTELKSKSEPVEEKKPIAFTEALTAREERLRKLKELLKERQKAVEAIRIIKSEDE